VRVSEKCAPRGGSQRERRARNWRIGGEHSAGESGEKGGGHAAKFSRVFQGRESRGKGPRESGEVYTGRVGKGGGQEVMTVTCVFKKAQEGFRTEKGRAGGGVFEPLWSIAGEGSDSVNIRAPENRHGGRKTKVKQTNVL